MNILFYLEPAIEFGNPLFRYATLRNSLLPQIKALDNTGENIVLLLSAPVAEKAIEDGHTRVIPQMAVIDPINWMDGENNHDRSMRHHAGNFRTGEITRLEGLIRNSLPNDFEPDLIIVWESPVNYLQTIFPSSRIIYQMPGFFSRPPFASLVSMDTGLLEHHQVVKHIDKELTEELEALSRLRKHEQHFLSTISPVREMINNIKCKFDSIILLPLQIDGYFMINSVLKEGRSQFSELIDLLTQIPENQALWVTNYKSRDAQSAVLTENNISFLEKRFPNFIYRKETDSIPCVSQFLVSEVDAIITISSSIGYQAAFWQKPLLTLGDSHITPFSTAESLEDLLIQAKLKSNQNRDPLIISALCTRHLSMQFVSGDAFASWLNKFHETGEFSSWTKGAVAEQLILERRESDVLQQLRYFEKVRNDSSIDHCNELSHQIIKHDIISFDIFDTLLYRPFKSPADMFDLMAEEVEEITGIASLDFRAARRSAENEAFKAAIQCGEGETTFKDIYKALALQLDLSEETCDRLMNLEMSLEHELLYPRVSGYKAFQEAKSLGKKIILISDMYLSKDFLCEVLKKNGYNGYEQIFVSSDYKAKKHNGVLFDRVLEQLDIEPNQILHIGDNVDADVKRAKERGIKPFHLTRASEVFTKNDNYQIPWARDENRHSLDWRMILAIIGNRIHDNPYIPHRKGTLFGGDPWKLGYSGFGPLLLGYAKWLIERSHHDGVEHLYFLSRDGKIMKDAYDRLRPLYGKAPESHYMLCSRRAVNLAKIEDETGIMDLLHVDFAHRTSLGHLLTHRFGVTQNDIPQETMEKHGYAWESSLTANDLPRLRALFVDIKEPLLTIAAEERTNYLDYINQGGLFANNNASIVDIGYAGTMQESLFLLSKKNKPIGGYYLMTFRAALKRIKQRGLPITGYLANFVDRHDTYHPFCRNVPLYETLFSSTDTSFVRMGRNWNRELYPIFMQRSPIEETREKLVREVHRGALDFIEDVVRILGPRLKTIDIEPSKSLRMLDKLFNDPHPRDARIFAGVMFEDAYGGRSHKTILPTEDKLQNECVWQKGLEALVRDQQIKQQQNAKQTQRKPVAIANGNLQQKTIQNKSNIEITLDWKATTIHWVLVNTLTNQKKQKFLRNPYIFFHDAKNPLVKKFGKYYLNSCKN